MAKYIRQEIIDLNNTGEKQVYYRMKSATHFTHEQFMEWMRSADPSVTRHIEAAISHLTHQLAVALAHGHSVKINGLGTFRAAVGLKTRTRQNSGRHATTQCTEPESDGSEFPGR